MTGEGQHFVEHTSQPEIQMPLRGVPVENCPASQLPVLVWLAPPAGLDTGLALQQLFLFIAVCSGVLFLKLLPPSLPIQNKNIICHVRWRMSKIKYNKTILHNAVYRNSYRLLIGEGQRLMFLRGEHSTAHQEGWSCVKLILPLGTREPLGNSFPPTF